MNAPVRLQLSRRRGFRLQYYSLSENGLSAVNCSRPGRWGNPYGTAAEFRSAFMDFSNCRTDAEFRAIAWMRYNIFTLRDRNLACWCPLPAPGEPDCCHAAVLLEIANR